MRRQAKLASLAMATGDPLHAAAIYSRRTLDDLCDLAQYSTVHQHLDDLTHLRHRIAILL